MQEFTGIFKDFLEFFLKTVYSKKLNNRLFLIYIIPSVTFLNKGVDPTVLDFKKVYEKTHRHNDLLISKFTL